MQNNPASKNFLQWFDPRKRQVGTWAFILNRITAIGLTIYLGLHLIMLGNLARGPEAYDNFIALAKSPLLKVGEMFVIAGGLIHGLNGIRVALTSFGIANQYQKQMFVGVIALSILGIAYFAYYMFVGA
jgi:succinate dehydrogenase / fumarate reductase, cytochrome b subunit